MLGIPRRRVPLAVAVEHAAKRFARPFIREVVAVAPGTKIVGGVDTGRPAVVFIVNKKSPVRGLRGQQLVSRPVPRRIKGWETDVVEMGEFVAFGISPQQQQARGYTGRYRPAPCGVSLGHPKVTAGTLGIYAFDRESGLTVAVTNNHVAAAENEARAGDPILQPGSYDGGKAPNDVLGTLFRFVPIRFEPKAFWAHVLTAFGVLRPAWNDCDAAAVRVENDKVKRRILDQHHYPVVGVEPRPYMAVAKTGRTTGYTEGTIQYVGAVVSVQYSRGRSARFRNQIILSPISTGGDSGAAVTSSGGAALPALLFAGSDKATVASPWRAVADALRVRL